MTLGVYWGQLYDGFPISGGEFGGVFYGFEALADGVRVCRLKLTADDGRNCWRNAIVREMFCVIYEGCSRAG